MKLPRAIAALMDEPAPKAQLTAHWRPVLYVPDAAVGERVAIGVVVTPLRGPVRHRFIADHQPLAALWGQQVTRNLPFLIEHMVAVIERGDTPSTPDLLLGEARELWGVDPEEGLASLFSRVCKGRS